MNPKSVPVICSLLGLVIVGAIFAANATLPSKTGYVLKRTEGESLPALGTIIKASPVAGSQKMEVFWSELPPAFSTGIHVHHGADELFIILRGKGTALVGGRETQVEAGDSVFIPKGEEHRMAVDAGGPMETVFLVDRPGLASEFREFHAALKAGTADMTIEGVNRITKKHGTTYKTVK